MVPEVVGDDVDVEFAVGIMFVDILQDGSDAILCVIAACADRAGMKQKGVKIEKERSQKDARKLRLFGSIRKARVKQFFVAFARRRRDDRVFGGNIDLRKKRKEVFPREIDPCIAPRIVAVGAVFRFHMREQIEKITRFQGISFLICFQEPLPADDVMQAKRHVIGNKAGFSLLGRLLHPHIAHTRRGRFVLHINIYAVFDLVRIRPVKNLFRSSHKESIAKRRRIVKA